MHPMRPQSVLRCPGPPLTEYVASTRSCLLPSRPVRHHRDLSRAGRRALPQAGDDISSTSVPPAPKSNEQTPDHAIQHSEVPGPPAREVQALAPAAHAPAAHTAQEVTAPVVVPEVLPPDPANPASESPGSTPASGTPEAPAASTSAPSAPEPPPPASALATAPTANEGLERDWLQPPPGDWGGVVDPEGIREPDSSGVLFFFILITGLSFGVHQLIRLAGGRGRSPEPLSRPAPAGMTAVVAVPASRALPRPSATPSRPEASAETFPADSSSARAAAPEPTGRPEVPTTSGSRGQPEALGREGLSRSRLADDSAGREGRSTASTSESRVAAEEGKEEDDEEEEQEEAMAAVAESEAASNEAHSEETEPASRQRRGPPVPPTGAQAVVSASKPTPVRGAPSAVADPAEERAGSLAAAGMATPDRAGADTAATPPETSSPPGEQLRQRSRDWHGFPLSGPPSGSGLEARGEAAPGTSEAAKRADAAAPAAPASAVAGGNGGTVGPSVTPTPNRPSGPPEQAGPGPGSSAPGTPPAPARTPGPFSALGPFAPASGRPSSPMAAPPSLQPETSVAAVAAAVPARISLPSVRPEPLSRAPDSSALAQLPTDDSLGSLRERAQLALRAAAAASEASQRAAAYAAAASSAASRAAEAAERAASAATVAQAGLESAAESAIVAAEARVAQAAEAAREAESRAASAAAHATAYQDMSQSQADIAERASNVARPAAPGPLSQLQQLWRSASSAFTHGNPSPEESRAGVSRPAGDQRAAPGAPQPSSGGAASRADAGSEGPSGPQGSGGVGAAETISSTVKGLLSWLGQGDGTR